MPNKAQWVTLEGGITNTFPLSINQAVYWTGLQRGECSAQDMTSYVQDGILSYSATPSPSTRFVSKLFVEAVADPAAQVRWYWAYGRWWRISPTQDTGYRLEYSAFGLEGTDPSAVTSTGSVDFNEDGNDEIRMISTEGDGTWFVLKNTCGYTLKNANGEAASFRRSAAYYGVGCSTVGRRVTNSVIGGHVATAWDGNGTHGTRHFLWSGETDPAELSRNVRGLAQGIANNNPNHQCRINWAESLVIADSIVYDLDQKRVFYFSGAQGASCTTRPYYHPLHIPIVIRSLALYTDGKDGACDVYLEFGQAEDRLERTKKYTVKVKNTEKRRTRHPIILDAPIRTRIYRIRIEGLSGFGIYQIDAEAILSESPDEAGGDE